MLEDLHLTVLEEILPLSRKDWRMALVSNFPDSLYKYFLQIFRGFRIFYAESYLFQVEQQLINYISAGKRHLGWEWQPIFLQANT